MSGLTIYFIGSSRIAIVAMYMDAGTWSEYICLSVVVITVMKRRVAVVQTGGSPYFHDVFRVASLVETR